MQISDVQMKNSKIQDSKIQGLPSILDIRYSKFDIPLLTAPNNTVGTTFFVPKESLWDLPPLYNLGVSLLRRVGLSAPNRIVGIAAIPHAKKL